MLQLSRMSGSISEGEPVLKGAALRKLMATNVTGGAQFNHD